MLEHDYLVDFLPYLSDPNFFQQASQALDDILNDAGYILNYGNGEVTGCYDYCDGYYSPGYYTAIYDLFVPATEVVDVFDKENFSLDALRFSGEVGEAFDDPNVAETSDSADAKLILEGTLGAILGETVAGVLIDPLPWPELPVETNPVPKPRKLPQPLPDAANDPNWLPTDWDWKILSRANVIICGLLLCSADGESDDWLEWREIGWEWAIQDLLEEGIDETEQPKIVIGEGEGEGGGEPYARIPSAALEFGAIYFSLGVDEQGQEVTFTSGQWTQETDMAMWWMNYGWITSMKLRQSLFYDIGLYGGRVDRGKFYACERNTLEGYAMREERYSGNTVGFSYGPCELW